MSGTDQRAVQAHALAARLFTAALSTAELFAAYLGVRLGLYAALATRGPLVPAQLAQHAGVAVRYAREWLEQQAAAGIVDVDDVAKDPDRRLYVLPPGHAEALTQENSPFFVAPMALLPVGAVSTVMPQLVAAYRSGEGVPYSAYGGDFHAGQALLNRAIFMQEVPAWIRRCLKTVDARLSAGGRVADIGCGAGWSSIGLATAYPAIHVDGFDLHEGSVAEAVRNAAAAGLQQRVHFHARSAPDTTGGYDLVCIFDALHDMSDPVAVLRTCHRLLSPGGSMLLIEPRAAETFTAPADEIERFLYAVSLLHCLPVGLSSPPSCGTGTVIRPATVRAHAAAAGFRAVDILPVDHRFHRAFHLTP
jgi:2-polyprenyl-3-methyl-5-hydroxy-6-metoxy-1,4-benzoquinol methylase